MKRNIFTLMVGVAVTTLVVGCYESPEVTAYEPGVYKGAKDPLTQSGADARAETLQKRFNLVQTDR